MKASELIAELTRRMDIAGDVEVMTTWEGTWHDIELGSVYLTKDGNSIFIDADSCNYKREFALPLEAITDQDKDED